MGYQLWTSPRTGYRRVGTRSSEVKELFVNRITVNSIFEPLKSCLISGQAFELKSELLNLDFDIAGVVNEEEKVVGYVKTSDLKSGTIDKYLKKFEAHHIISDSTSILELFTALRSKSFLFVLSGSTISGIVTKADLNKPPIRIYLFGIISLLEMHLAYWINKIYTSGSWKAELSKPRQEMAQKLFEEKKLKNQEIDLLSCTQFGDKKTIICKNSVIRERLNLGGRNKVKENLKYVENLRDNLAHSQSDLAGEYEWGHIIDTISWIEFILCISDREIEKDSKKSSENYSKTLL